MFGPNGIMGGASMWAMSVIRLLVLIVLILGIGALAVSVVANALRLRSVQLR